MLPLIFAELGQSDWLLSGKAVVPLGRLPLRRNFPRPPDLDIALRREAAML